MDEAEPRCEGCGLPFGAECTVGTVDLAGSTYPRVPLGAETTEWWVGREPDAICHDCSAGTGQRHHVGCDMEQCPHCENQLLTCECE